MCASKIKIKGIRRSSMIQDAVPLKFSSSVVVDNGNDSEKSMNEEKLPESNTVKDIIKTITVLTSLFTVFLLKGNTAIFRFNTPSRITLLHEIEHLKHDLESFEKLKKELVDEEIQLSWDKQHILESEDIVKSMTSSSEELSQRFHDEELRITEANHHMHEEIMATSKLGNNAAKQDHESVLNLSRDIEATYAEVKSDHQENDALRRQIAQMLNELRRQNIAVSENLIDMFNSKQYRELHKAIEDLTRA